MRHLYIAVFFLLATTFACFSARSQACSAPLSGGSVSVLQNAVCGNYYNRFTVAGSSTGTGLTYQWERSYDNTNWSAISYYNTEEMVISQLVTTWYRRKIRCGGDSAVSSTVQVTQKAATDCYCVPGTTVCTSLSITNVVYSSLNNASACGANGYTDFTATVAAADVPQGSYLPIAVTVSNPSNSRFVHCFIDFNQSGTFDAKEYTRLWFPTGSVYSGFVKVPFGAKLGKTRMRLVYSGNATTGDACFNDYNSEAEDYSINIVPKTSSANGHVIHVKTAAAGSNNTGSSWANALMGVRDALILATPGDTIKVAKGLYYTGTSQTNGYELLDSITVLGGYPDSGTPTDAQRDFARNQTILAGKPNSNSTIPDYHTVYAKGTMNNCVLDGFILQDGGTYYGSDAPQTRGGGISLENGANIVVKNCVFRRNTAPDGAAISVYNARPVFQNCVVAANDGYRSNILIQQASQVSFLNLLAAKNGGASLLQTESSGVIFKNSTIAANNVTEGLAFAANKSTVSFVNSITYYNTVYNASWQSTSFDSTEIKLDASTATFQNCLTEVQNEGLNLLLGQSPKFSDTTTVAGADGFYFTADDGFSLNNPCSPAINAGANTDAAGIVTDIKGEPRVFGSKVDLGAYEVQQNLSAIPKVLYVNAAATGRNDGSSWANAFTDLHKALQSCSDTIKIAAGTYTPWKTPAGRPYRFENKRVILGAYPATGSPANADRNYSLYATNIDGLTNSGEKAETVVMGQNLDSTSVVDGLTITNTGRYGTSNFYGYGAVIYTYCNNPIISNWTFANNFARVFLGRHNRQPLMLNCRFSNNVSVESYRLDMVVLQNSGNFTFRNCVFRDNSLLTSTSTSGEFGRVVLLENTNAVVDSCTFLRNRSTVFHTIKSNPVFTETQFLQNYANDQTTDMRNEFSNPVFRNCVFRDSAWTYFYSWYGGVMYNKISSPVFTDCQFYNGGAVYGGVAYNDSSSAKFTRCVFSNCNNVFFNTNSSDIELVNCIGTGSRQTDNHTVYPYGRTGSFMNNVRSSPRLINCVVVNGDSGPGGVMFNQTGSAPQISNTLFWKNFSAAYTDTSLLNARADILNDATSQTTVHHSMFEFYDGGTGNNNTRRTDPRFKNFANPVGPDGRWFTADDGLQLCDCSPAINSGNNAATGETTDIAGLPRVFGPSVDRGAYELQALPQAVSHTVFVNAAAGGANKGSSWTDAYTGLQPALANACADTIKMAAGTYKPAAARRDSMFYVNRNLVVLGSYDVATGKRDVDSTATILSGDLGIAGDASDNSFGIMKASYTDTLLIDGVVFRDASSEGVDTAKYNNGLRADFVLNLSLTNDRFYNNRSNQSGGALLVSSSKNLLVEKTVFNQNRALWGGGLYLSTNGPSRRIENCVFDGNEARTGGGIWLSQPGTSIAGCLFTRNMADEGAGMTLDNAPDMKVTNCSFVNNRAINGGYVGAGIYCTGYSWQGGGAGPLIANCIFTGNNADGSSSQQVFQDIYYPKNAYPPYDGKVELRIHHTASSTQPYYYWGTGNIWPGNIRYKNATNPAGPDGRWFTEDDGLHLSACSDGIDAGDSASISLVNDLAGEKRIINKVDLGAYEYNLRADWSGLLSRANDSLVANKEITDTLGWTHYFNDCRYLLSIRKNGKDIGTIGDGTFELKVFTGASYGSGQGTNLTAAAYNTGGMPWYVMNRYWNVKSTHPVQDSVLVRFPYTTADFNDVKGSNPAVVQQKQMEFFKVSGTSNPFDLDVPAANFFRYKNGDAPSLSTWTYQQQDTVHLCEYYVSSFSGGGGGAFYNGALPDLALNNITTSTYTLGTGGTLTASFEETNGSATGMAGQHKVQFYLSADEQLTPGANTDTLLGAITIPTVNAASSTGSLKKNLTIPCNITPGTYYLFLVTDGENAVAESNEQNNNQAVMLTVTPGLSLPAVPTITASPGITVCDGTTVTLTGSASGCVSCAYSWSNGTTTPVLATHLSGTYTFTATNACGSASVSQAIAVKPLPYVTGTSAPEWICLGDSAALTGNGAETYTWSGIGLGNAAGKVVKAKPATTGNAFYTLTGTTNGCSNTASVRVVVQPRPVLSLAPADTTYCAGGSLALTVSGAERYIWSPLTALTPTTMDGSAVTVAPATVTTYTVTGVLGECTNTLTRTVAPQAVVVPSVTIAYSGCPDNRLTFTATSTNGGTNPQYNWYLNGTLQGSGASIVLSGVTNGADVYASMTSGLACALPGTVRSDTVKVSCITTAVPVVDGLEALAISPNPSNGLFAVKIKLAQLKKVAFKVADGNGKVLYESAPVNVLGSQVKQIDLRGKAQGLYFLQVAIGGKTVVGKLVIAQ